MLRTVLVVIVILAITVGSLHSQDAIGLRFGGSGEAFGGEIGYQKQMGANRLWLGFNFDFDSGTGWSSTYLTLFPAYHFVFPTSNDMRFYAGPGIQATMWMMNFSGALSSVDNISEFILSAGGVAGIEMDINNLTIGFEARPLFRIITPDTIWWKDDDFFISYGLTLKYRF